MRFLPKNSKETSMKYILLAGYNWFGGECSEEA
jgi:hypothetical protein